MNKFIIVSILLLCLLALLNLNKAKPVPEKYAIYDSQLREFYNSYKKGEREEAKKLIKEAYLIIPVDHNGDELDSVLISELDANSALNDLNLRKLISSAFESDVEFLPLTEDVEITLKAYADTRFFLERANSYKEKIEKVDEHLKVNVVTAGRADLKEEFLNFDIYEDLEMYLPGSSLMIEMGVSDGK